MTAPADLCLQQVKIFRRGSWQEVDLSLDQGKIASVRPSGGKGSDARQSLDLAGRMVSPGWVDLHTHLLPLRWGGIGTWPEKIGLRTGVTALLDVGTTGAKNFPLFYDKVIRHSPTPIYALLNIKAHGIRPTQLGRETQPDDDLPAMAEAVKRYPDRIKGVKITASQEHMLVSDPLYYMRKAREAADHLGLPLMVHFGRTPPELAELLPLMKPGDLLTHTFRNGAHTILNKEGRVREDVLAARARGVRFDVGHGVGSFSFVVAEQALAQGFDRFTISSDLYLLSRPFRAHDFAHVLSKFLVLGLKLEEVMERASAWPAEWLGLPRSLEPGAPAALTVFRKEPGRFRFRDCWNQLRIGSERIVPELSILDGTITTCS
jgi:dihydroorotase